MFGPLYSGAIIEEHKDKIDWTELSTNPNAGAVALLTQNPNKIDWYWLFINPEAIELIVQSPKKFDWSWSTHLSKNPNAIALLTQYPDKINLHWWYLSMNPNAGPWACNMLAQHVDKIDWAHLSRNPNACAVALLAQHLDKIHWYWLSGNPEAIALLVQHPKKIHWRRLSGNPNAISLFAQLDYGKMRLRALPLAEELAAYVSPQAAHASCRGGKLGFHRLFDAFTIKKNEIVFLFGYKTNEQTNK